MGQEKLGRWLTVSKIAEELDIHEETVRRWIKSGELAAVKIGNKAGYRIWSKDYEEFLAARSTKNTATLSSHASAAHSGLLE